MASRGKATFQKREKEIARKAKQQRKAARREQRKLDNGSPGETILQDQESSAEVERDAEPPEA